MTEELELKIIELVKKHTGRADVCRDLGWPRNGNYYKRINLIIQKYQVDISHFWPNKAYKTIKYEVIIKICPVCKKEFKTKKDFKKEKTTCSKACSNTHFRSGENNPNWTPFEEKTEKAQKSYSGYRKLFNKTELFCHRCGYKEFDCSVQIHHIDENRKNNDKSNLIPLCANCHMSFHANKWNLEDIN